MYFIYIYIHIHFVLYFSVQFLLFICGLFEGFLNISEYITLTDGANKNNKLEFILNSAVVA